MSEPYEPIEPIEPTPGAFAALSMDAIVRGGAVTALLCGPLAIVNSLAQSGRDNPSSGIGALFSLLILMSAGVGGWVAGGSAPGRAVPNGAAAAAAGYLVVQAIGLLVATVSGGVDGLALIGMVYLSLLMATCGMIGAAIANRQHRAGQAEEQGEPT